MESQQRLPQVRRRFLVRGLRLGLVGVAMGFGALAWADSIWDRHDPWSAFLFRDTRAWQTGDLLTLLVRETTVFDGRDNRQLRRKTFTSGIFKFRATGGSSGAPFSSGSNANLDTSLNSDRNLEVKTDYKTDRTFLDRVTVKVVAVEPNGNLIVEGFRRRVVTGEERLVRITGYVRPYDVTPLNTVESHLVGNFNVSYIGRGQETNTLTSGWFGRVGNRIWPF
jgi:flagellar L-ring protein precursor FlgH